MPNIVLLGDSIFDNAAYVADRPDVIAQLRSKLPAHWTATLNAIDGSKIKDVFAQLDNLPSDATHLVLSVGGNNALSCTYILNEAVRSSTQVFGKIADLSEEFEQQYRKLLDRILSFRLPTTLCTIYYPCLSDRTERRLAIAALTLFNDVIIRQAFQSGLPLVDLRLTCNESADYANPIEPSSIGGEKIANAIVNVVLEHEFDRLYTRVFY